MLKTFDVLRSEQCDADLEAIFDHLVEAYRSLGEPAEQALDHAEVRLMEIEDQLEDLGKIPFQGTLVPKILNGLRYVRKGSCVFYFSLDEPTRELRVLAVFFSGQDHQQHILNRIRAISGESLGYWLLPGNRETDEWPGRT